jgi:hypothetical protein
MMVASPLEGLVRIDQRITAYYYVSWSIPKISLNDHHCTRILPRTATNIERIHIECGNLDPEARSHAFIILSASLIALQID